MFNFFSHCNSLDIFVCIYRFSSNDFPGIYTSCCNSIFAPLLGSSYLIDLKEKSKQAYFWHIIWEILNFINISLAIISLRIVLLKLIFCNFSLLITNKTFIIALIDNTFFLYNKPFLLLFFFLKELLNLLFNHICL